MNKKYKLAVFIGRFQIPHYGHFSIIDQALNIADKVLIIIGSHNSPRSIRNPFLSDDRKEMILSYYHHRYSDYPRLNFRYITDSMYNDSMWVKDIQDAVSFYAYDDEKVTLIGHSKDSSSYYLSLFPQWDSSNVENYQNLNSTDIREQYFTSGSVSSDVVPLSVIDLLEDFSRTEDYQRIKDEYQFIKRYKESWKAAPYPPIFVTVDACVVQSGHILLVKRGQMPGKGLWALPGGFLNQNELIEDAVIRELREETKIKVPDPVLRGSIKTSKVFDDPNRSMRGRTITHGFLIHLKPDTKLPKVKGSDDAEKSKWVPLHEINRADFFEDHYDIITNLTSLI
jgi:bifunctional NMN adenylyltransferase/nudix hydrolase